MPGITLTPAQIDALAALGFTQKPAAKPAPKRTKPAQGKPATAKVARERNGTKPARKPAKSARKCCMTAHEAWEALGADPEFQPGNPDKPASSAMLWRLNDQGLLADALNALA